MRIRHLAGIAAVAAATLTACGSDSTTDTTAAASADTMVDDKMTDDSMADDKMTDDSMADDKMTDDSMADDKMAEDEMSDDKKSDEMSDDAMAGPAFMHLALTDVNGESFQLADFMGKPVFVETFATWCPKCQSQLNDTNAAAGEVGDAAQFVALSIEADIAPEDVASYAADNGFDNVRFAVVTPEFLAAVTEHFGAAAANAPGTPHFIVDTHGEPGELLTGTASSSDIVSAVNAAA